MKVLTREEFNMARNEYMWAAKGGALFIYPTDTIYGIGCNALDGKAVAKIRALKKRISQPFSIIAPSKEWLYENCIVHEEAKKWIEKLPGPYTLILKLENKNAVAKDVANGLDTLGVRIPNHWFSDVINDLGFPIVTTSANITGQDNMTSLEDLDKDIKKGIDFCIYEGEKKGKPSELIHLEGEKTKVEKRKM